jgi:hypothetical protein
MAEFGALVVYVLALSVPSIKLVPTPLLFKKLN